MTNRNSISTSADVKVLGEVTPAFAEILTPDALAYLATLTRAFDAGRLESLARRQAGVAELADRIWTLLEEEVRSGLLVKSE